MYNLPYYKESDPVIIEAFISEHPFAFVTGCDANSQPVATQVPLFIERHGDKKVLRGHIMKHTDHHLAFQQNNQVLAVFTSPHTYVSGSWYSNPHIASTWNYMSVQVKGLLRFLDQVGLENILRKTTLHFEHNDASSPTTYDQLPTSFKDKYLGAIAGFEIEITNMDAVFKLSQDRDQKSYDNIISKLNEQGPNGQYIAGEMEKRKDKLFR